MGRIKTNRIPLSKEQRNLLDDWYYERNFYMNIPEPWRKTMEEVSSTDTYKGDYEKNILMSIRSMWIDYLKEKQYERIRNYLKS